VRRRKLAVFWLILIGVIAAITEVLVRLTLDPPALYPRPQETSVITLHPVRGYALLPSASGQYTAGGHSAKIRINERGFRDGPYAEALRSDLRILALGDSFTLGLGVDSVYPWPKQLELLLRPDFGPRANVVNAGVPGYSARQMRQTGEEVIPELQPRIVVFGMNVETYWRVESPYVYRGGQLVSTSFLTQVTVGRRGLYLSRTGEWVWLQRLDLWLNEYFETGAHFLALAQRLYGLFRDQRPGDLAPPRRGRGGEADPDKVSDLLQPLLAEIGKMSEVAHSRGVEFVVLLVNPQERDGSFRAEQWTYNRIVSEYCRKRGIRVVDPLPILAGVADGRPILRTFDDYHWTREAHRIVAGALFDYLSREGMLPRRVQAR
jgi:GDSL-like Lipase/Acylhydrolase family